MAERILIVDDEETLCEVLKLNLENEGYDVDIAFSAEEAPSPPPTAPKVACGSTSRWEDKSYRDRECLSR